MFYYDNSKLRIRADTRCGSTSMRQYFQREWHDGSELVYDKNTIVVLRNPLDRVISAVRGVKGEYLRNTTEFKEDFAQGKIRKFGLSQTTNRIIFYNHCSPIFHHIIDKEFRIIDFYKLQHYIVRSLDNSPITYSSGYTDPKEVYVKNKYFTLEELEREYDLYQQFLREKEQISIEEWKEKTP